MTTRDPGVEGSWIALTVIAEEVWKSPEGHCRLKHQSREDWHAAAHSNYKGTCLPQNKTAESLTGFSSFICTEKMSSRCAARELRGVGGRGARCQ